MSDADPKTALANARPYAYSNAAKVPFQTDAGAAATIAIDKRPDEKSVKSALALLFESIKGMDSKK